MQHSIPSDPRIYLNEMPWKIKLGPKHILKCNFGVEFPEGTRDSPRVWFFVFVVQWLDLLLFLLLAQLGGVGELEELGGKLHQPFGVNGCHLPHILLGRQDQLMVDHPAQTKHLSKKLFLP